MLSSTVYSKEKILHHPQKVQSLLEGRVTPPIYVRVKPTNVCNHGCFYCTYADRKGNGNHSFSGIHERTVIRDKIPEEKMEEILKDFRDMGIKAVTYSGGGEPLLYPYIRQTLERTLEYGIDLSMITHGQFLMNPEAEPLKHAKWVRISQDAISEEEFSRIRRINGKHFETIKRNAEEFAKIKDKDCVFGINFVVSEENVGDVYEGAKMWKDIGVSYVRFSPVWGPNFEQYHAPHRDNVEEQLRRAKEDLNDTSFEVHDSFQTDFELEGRSFRTYSWCPMMQVVPVIGADQNVYFCHNKAYSTDGKMGSIKDQSFKKLWFSEETTRIFREFDPSKSCNHQCANDRKNIKIIGIVENGKIPLEKIMASNIPHVNFI